MKKKLQVVLVTAEAAPYARAGERAGFSTVLPQRLSSAGARVSVVMPRYMTPEIDALETVRVFPEIFVPLGGDRAKAAVHKAPREDFNLYFIDHPKYFRRENIYGPATGDYLDNDERFIFFSRASLEFLIAANLHVDIIHSLDWPTALVPVFLKSHYAGVEAFRKARSVFTFHGHDSRGEFPAESLVWTGLGWDFFASRKVSSNGKIDLLKAGLIFADVVTVVPGGFSASTGADGLEPGLKDVLSAREDSFFCLPGDDDWSDYLALYEQALNSKRGG